MSFLETQGWETQAACGKADPELFAPIGARERHGTPARVLKALRYCRGLNPDDKGACPVMAQCAKLREDHGYTGVWGGQWWPDSQAPTGYSNGLLRGSHNGRRATTPIGGEAA